MTTPHSHTPGAGHEQQDVNPRAVMIAALVLTAVVVLVSIGAGFLLLHYAARETRRSAPASPLGESYGRRVPPEPRLQADPLGDLHALRAEEDALLNGYGRVDRQAGTVRIPIERAMDILADRSAANAGRGQP
jgi:hypothetical protein